MIDARLELAPDRTAAPPWPQRLATLGVFLANGLGIGSWAAAIPRLKADLALSDAGLSVALMAFAAGAIVAMLLMGAFGYRLGRRRSSPVSPSQARLPRLALPTRSRPCPRRRS
jgi:MFS family permease